MVVENRSIRVLPVEMGSGDILLLNSADTLQFPVSEVAHDESRAQAIRRLIKNALNTDVLSFYPVPSQDNLTGTYIATVDVTASAEGITRHKGTDSNEVTELLADPTLQRPETHALLSYYLVTWFISEKLF